MASVLGLRRRIDARQYLLSSMDVDPRPVAGLKEQSLVALSIYQRDSLSVSSLDDDHTPLGRRGGRLLGHGIRRRIHDARLSSRRRSFLDFIPFLRPAVLVSLRPVRVVPKRLTHWFSGIQLVLH